MSQKRLGIITFHTANNYGAVLQAYALQEVCKALGYDVYFIRYSGYDYQGVDNPLKHLINEKGLIRKLKKTLRSSMSYYWDLKRNKAFKRFTCACFKQTILCDTVEEIRDLNFDVYIAGSDQIWNYRITGNRFHSAYFLNFETPASKIVYAASSQDVPFPPSYEKEFISELLGTRAFIGIREKSLAAYASSLTKKKYPVVLDPVLLAGKAVFDEFEYKRLIKESYIMIYQIDNNPDSDINVRLLEKRFNRKVITMTVPRLGSINRRKGVSSPVDFLNLLRGADFLVTNSFHGVALAILYEKKFYVYENNGVMSRIDDLLELTGIQDRKVQMVSDIDESSFISYMEPLEKLKISRKRSLDFLLQALEERFNYEPYEIIHNTDKKRLKFSERKDKDCSGCSACAEGCPVEAIDMKENAEGFLYPVLNVDKCIHCGLCDRICRFQQPEKNSIKKAFGVKLKDTTIRKKSRSGGAFIALSDYILKKNGVIYGAVLQEDFSVKHERAVTVNERNKMQKAKYVQSNTNGIFSFVEKDLVDGYKVLFSGTPCQVAGLLGYLEEKHVDISSLITCDLICHGVPSPKVWKDYLCYLSRKNKKKIIAAQFRDKEYGWNTHYESFELEGNRKKIVTREYTDLFYQHIMFRPACANCKFANMHRIADITLGDFWGIEKHDENFDDNLGVSLVFINSEKGNMLFSRIKENIDCFECVPDMCLQPTLQRPSIPSPKREEFWNDYLHYDIGYILKKYTVPASPKARLKRNIKKLMYAINMRNTP